MRKSTVGVKAGTAIGSGVVLEDGFVLSAAHVVKRIGEQVRIFVSDGTERSAVVHSIDRRNDVSLLKLKTTNGLTTARLQGRFHERAYVFAIGNPGGFEPKRASLVRFGIAASTLDQRKQRVLQSTCRLARGDSGGPLFDEHGDVVGIHRQIRKGISENYHTSAAQILGRWDRLKAGGVIDGETSAPPQSRSLAHPFDDRPITEPRVAIEVLVGGQRVAVGTIVDRKRGLIVTKASELHGEITVGLSRRSAKLLHVDRRHDLAVLKTPKGWPVEQQTRTDGRSTVGMLVLTQLPVEKNPVGILGAPERSVPREPGKLGVQLTSQLVVENIQPNSAASEAGLEVGDRLTHVAGEPVSMRDHVGTHLKGLNAGDRLTLKFERDGKPQSVSVQLKHAAGKRFADKTFQLGAAGASSMRRTGFGAVIQHDCRIEPNQCGSPLITLGGEFVGINIAKVGREAVYCIPARVVHQVVEAAVLKLPGLDQNRQR